LGGSKVTGNLAVDTNAVIAYRADIAGAAGIIDAAACIMLPLPVLGELLFGAAASGRPEENRQAVLAFAETCTLLEPTMQTAEVYASTRAALKSQGRPIPENDVWIAALCLQWDLPLLTRDGHFKQIKNLSVVTLLFE
jgi:tRNA(fMet)-specific endonuclease VapC